VTARKGWVGTMRGRTVVLIGTVAALWGCAGDRPAGHEPPDAETLAGIASRSLKVTPMGVHADTLLDVIGARVSALPSGDSAEVFVARRLEGMGLEGVRLEPFPLLAWDRRDASLEVVAPRGVARGGMNILSLGHVGSFEVTAPVLDAGYGTAEEIAELGERVRGRIVMVDVGSPPGYGRGVHRTEKVTLATRAGAVGFIQVNDREGPLVPIGVATMGDYETEIPAVAADHATGARLQEILARAGGDVRVRLRISNWMERSQARNVLADIPGETDEVVLVGAHLDSWDLAEGAVDNGSGTLATLDVAAALADHVRRTGHRPLRTIRFAFWMGEELGLYGSRAHVEDRLEDGRLDRYAAALNLDVVGAPVGLGAMGRPDAEPLLRRVRDALVDAGFELDDEFPTGGSLYSDHQPFLMQGIPIITLRSRQRPEAAGVSHTTADLREVLDEAGMARSAGVAAALIWAVANEPELGWDRWPEESIGPRLEALGLRDPLERAGEWRWP
jgi:carboxypeptidase Q